MADVFSKEKRSQIMARIRSKNTGPELVVFKELRKRKIYFQSHYARVAGRPDVALPAKKRAVFIDGDFWHGYRFSPERLPATYWRDKIGNNVARDRRTRAKLKREGWEVLRVWEHDVKRKLPATIERIEKFLVKGA